MSNTLTLYPDSILKLNQLPDSSENQLLISTAALVDIFLTKTKRSQKNPHTPNTYKPAHLKPAPPRSIKPSILVLSTPKIHLAVKKPLKSTMLICAMNTSHAKHVNGSDSFTKTRNNQSNSDRIFSIPNSPL